MKPSEKTDLKMFVLLSCTKFAFFDQLQCLLQFTNWTNSLLIGWSA